MKTVNRGKIHGFSLVELMVVIAIVAILAAVVMPSYKNYILKSKVGAVVNLVGFYKSKYLEAHSLGKTAILSHDNVLISVAADAGDYFYIIINDNGEAPLNGMSLAFRPSYDTSGVATFVCSMYGASGSTLLLFQAAFTEGCYPDWDGISAPH